MDTGEEYKKHEGGGFLSRKAARFHMSPCRERNKNAIPKKDSNRATPADAECRPRHEPPSHEGPCAGKESKQQAKRRNLSLI